MLYGITRAEEIKKKVGLNKQSKRWANLGLVLAFVLNLEFVLGG